MDDVSYDMRIIAGSVKRHMWWKNKKVCIALILLVITAGFGIALLAGAFKSKSLYAFMYNDEHLRYH
jgi:hypothetical protein